MILNSLTTIRRNKELKIKISLLLDVREVTLGRRYIFIMYGMSFDAGVRKIFKTNWRDFYNLLRPFERDGTYNLLTHYRRMRATA